MVTASVTWHFLKFIIIWYNFCLSYLNFHLEMVSILFVLWSACVFYFSTWTGKMRVVWMIVAALHSRLCLEFIPNHLQSPFLSKLSAHYNVTSVGMNILLDEGSSLSCLLKLWPSIALLCSPNSCQFLPNLAKTEYLPQSPRAPRDSRWSEQFWPVMTREVRLTVRPDRTF